MNMITEAIKVLAEMESLAQKVARQRAAEQDEKESAESRRKHAAVSKVVLSRAREQQRAETDAIAKISAKKKAKAAAQQQPEEPHQLPKPPEPHEPEAAPHAVQPHHSALQHLRTHAKFKFHVGKELTPAQKLHNLHQVHKIHRKAADFYRRVSQDHPEGSPEHAKLHSKANYYDSKADAIFSRINHHQHVG